MVEVDITFGQIRRKISALCIPSINIRLHLPGLSRVVQGFVQKGYKLADEKLLKGGDDISNIDFILGTKSAFCAIATEISFGPNRTSVYAQSEMGVMLLDETKSMLVDLKSLHEATVSSIGAFCMSTQENVSELNAYNYLGISTNNVIREENCEDSNKNLIVSAGITVLNDKGNLVESELQRATDQILEKECHKYINYDQQVYEIMINKYMRKTRLKLMIKW